MRTYFYAIICFSIWTLISCKKDDVTTDEMCNTPPQDSCVYTITPMNGVSFENVPYPMDASHTAPIVAINATWVTTMPFGYVLFGGDSVLFNSGFQWHGEKIAGVIENVNVSHEAGLKVMIKPHLWFVDGTWVGDATFSTESAWQAFERTYLNYIVAFANVADSTNADAFCIGVEMKKVVTERPAYWSVLIDTVRSIYDGPITYAANWDNYQNVTFWNQLDYIGIDAYFPLSEAQTPSFESCYAGWENDFQQIKALSGSIGKKVVFTEFGYRNIDFTGKEPWNENSNSTYNSTGQENAYLATFCRFWGQSWFEGGFLWKWHPIHASAGGEDNNRFTPQNKPVADIISSVFEASN